MKLIHARLIDGTGAPPQADVTLMFDRRITAITPGPATADPGDGATLDVAGRTVIPGLINAHTHITLDDRAPDAMKTLRDEPPAALAIRAAGRARRMLEAGITTARDLGAPGHIDLAVRDLIRGGEIPGPRLLCAGLVITMTGGHGWPLGRECDGPDEVRKAVREQLKAGVDVVKFMATGGVLTPGVEPGAAQLDEDELRAGIAEAHKADRRTATHAQGTAGIKAALRAGIDTVEHGIFLDAEAIALLRDREVVFVPTLAAPYQIAQAGAAKGIPAFVLDKNDRIIEAHRQSVRAACEAGIIMAAGNDGGTPFNPVDDLVTEIRLLAENGLAPLEALQAATLGSARALGLEDEVGTLLPGRAADLVVLDGDPLADLSAVDRIWCVIQAGRVVYRRELDA